MTDYLRIVAPFHNSTGYSRAARGLLSAALLAGYEVEAVESDLEIVGQVVLDGEEDAPEWTPRYIEEQRPAGRIDVPEAQREELERALKTRVPCDSPTILYQLPEKISGWTEYDTGPRIGYTMVECDGVRPEIVDSLRYVDLLCTPSQYCADTFRNALTWHNCLTLPDYVFVLPNVIDPRIYEVAANPPLSLQRSKPNFLFTAITTAHERKHWRELLHAFAEEFRSPYGTAVRNDVGLFIKTDRPGLIDDLAASCRKFGANVRVDSTPWTDNMISGLLSVTDCYVLPSCEGFGLPFCEAAYFDVPSIALDKGGQRDVVTEGIGYPVASHPVPCVGLSPLYFSSKFRWPSCMVEDLRAKMREAWMDTPAARHGKGQAAKERVMERFTPLAITETLRQAVEMAKKRFERRNSLR
jgi:glycosyltransferase involved in cell wall biosynthesis